MYGDTPIPSGARSVRAFTLIEVVVVLSIIGLVFAFGATQFGGLSFWKDETFVRRFAETVKFLHFQAISDQTYYILQIKQDSYRAGVLRVDSDVNENLTGTMDPEVGTLTLELADYLNPSMGDSQTIIPPPSFPSLAERQPLPDNAYFKKVKKAHQSTELGKDNEAYITFSPRGFTEFAVIHLRLRNDRPVTFLVSPFTGEVEIYRDEREFEWTYGKGNQ